jgi:hypothetical protein
MAFFKVQELGNFERWDCNNIIRETNLNVKSEVLAAVLHLLGYRAV